MLTKGDLSAIKSIVVHEVKSIVKQEIDTLKIELDKKMDNNTNELIELIVSGFKSHDADFQGHEHRIIRLEQVTFPSN